MTLLPVCALPDGLQDAVLCRSVPVENAVHINGPDLNAPVLQATVHADRLSALLSSYATMGLQASQLGRAMGIVNAMLSHETRSDGKKCKIFLGYTSNMVSSGVRDVIRYLVQHRLVDVVVTSAGGIEEDLIKCLAPTILADFRLDGATLRKRGQNRIGNMLVPNDNYCRFEDWLMPVLDAMHAEQTTDGTLWSPSKVISRLGREIDCEESICYWAHKNGIPIYCPALTDGSLGDMLYFHAYRRPGLVIDAVSDICAINSEAVFAPATGMVILGGGVVKHHICNANLMRNGAEYGVFINTGCEWDGSDSGADPDEAVSWGKLKPDALMVKVHCDASIAFPLLVAETFSQHQGRRLAKMADHLYI